MALLSGESPAPRPDPVYDYEKPEYFATRMDPELLPRIFIAGSSEEAVDLSVRHGAVAVTNPAPANLFVDGFAASVGRRTGLGVRFGLIVRETSEEAWAAARRYFPPNRAAQINVKLHGRASIQYGARTWRICQPRRRTKASSGWGRSCPGLRIHRFWWVQPTRWGVTFPGIWSAGSRRSSLLAPGRSTSPTRSSWRRGLYPARGYPRLTLSGVLKVPVRSQGSPGLRPGYLALVVVFLEGSGAAGRGCFFGRWQSAEALDVDGDGR